MTHQPITDAELAAIEADHTLINTGGLATPEDKPALDRVTTDHIPRLVAEIRRLRTLLAPATRFEVSVLAPDDINRSHFTITVEHRGNDRWAVCRHGECLDVHGTWDYELRPSERDDEWVVTHRFDLDMALRLAQEAAPHLRVNGHSAVDAAALHAKRNA